MKIYQHLFRMKTNLLTAVLLLMTIPVCGQITRGIERGAWGGEGVVWDYHPDEHLIVIYPAGGDQNQSNFRWIHRDFGNQCLGNRANELKATVKKVIIKPGIVRIGYRAFQDWTALETVSIPNTVNHIENYVFMNTGLRTITIPPSVNSIEIDAFKSCPHTVKVISLKNSDYIVASQYHVYEIFDYSLTQQLPLYIPADGWKSHRYSRLSFCRFFITGSTEEAFYAGSTSQQVRMVKLADGISLSKSHIELNYPNNRHAQLSPIIDATDDIYDWYSSNEEAVYVSQNGYITALRKNCSATITVISRDLGKGEKKATCEVTVKNNNTEIQSLLVNGQEIPNVSIHTQDYSVDVSYNVTTAIVTGTTTGGEGIVSREAKDLNVGKNHFTVTVTDDDGVVNSYNVTVNRLSNATLEQIDVFSGTGELLKTLNILPEVYTYDITVPNAVTDVRLEAKNDPRAIADTLQRSGALSVGDNRFRFVTIAESRDIVKEYTVNIRRKSSDATLKNIYVNGEAIKQFDPNKTSYEVAVPNGTGVVIVKAERNSATAFVRDSLQAVIPSYSNPWPFNFSIKAIAEDANFEKTYTVSVIEDKSADATLKNISFTDIYRDNLVYTPDNISNTMSFVVPYSVTEISLKVEPNHAKASVSGAENQLLQVGANSLSVRITSEDGTITKEYSLDIWRENGDATLKTLGIEFGNTVYTVPAIVNDIDDYTITVPVGTPAFRVVAEQNDPLATVSISNNPIDTWIPLTWGNNGPFPITVTADDNSITKTYNLTVTRPANSDASLRVLTPSIGTLEPEFNKDVFEYCVYVERSINNIAVHAEPTDTAATIIIGKSAPELEESEIKLTVIAENKSKQIYKITVIRPSTFSSDATLQTLTPSVGKLEPAFNKNTLSYKINVGTRSRITFNATHHGGAKVAGINEEYILPVGNTVFDITVTSENENDTQNYQVTVTREAPLSSLSISNGELQPPFSYATLSYTAMVDYTVMNIMVSETHHQDAIVTGGNKVLNKYTALDTGTTPFTITVTFGNEALVYTVNVERLDRIISGKCGDDISWELTYDVLTIKGKGDMPRFTTASYPWYHYRSVIKSVVVEEGVTSIADAAFSDYSALTSISLPKSLTKIGNDAFRNSSLTRITLPEGLENIGDYAFYNCANLISVTILHTQPQNIPANAFTGDNSELAIDRLVLYVPEDCTNSYEAASTWNRFGKILTVNEEVGLGIARTVAPAVQVYLNGKTLHINSPVAEQISANSIMGTLLGKWNKQTGEMQIKLSGVPQVIILKGSSGWTRKLVIND